MVYYGAEKKVKKNKLLDFIETLLLVILLTIFCGIMAVMVAELYYKNSFYFHLVFITALMVSLALIIKKSN